MPAAYYRACNDLFIYATLGWLCPWWATLSIFLLHWALNVVSEVGKT